jgi:hypothetical protein
MASDRIAVPITRSIADYREAYMWLPWRTRSWRLLAIPAVAIVGSLVLASDLPGRVTFVAVSLCAMAAVYYAALLGIAAKMYRAHLRNGATTYTFSPAGFDCNSERSTSSTQWSALQQAVETRRSFLLVYPNTCFLIVPKSCIPAGEIEYLRSLLQSNLAGKTSLRPA